MTGIGWTGWKWLVMAGMGENDGNSCHEKSGKSWKWLETAGSRWYGCKWLEMARNVWK